MSQREDSRKVASEPEDGEFPPELKGLCGEASGIALALRDELGIKEKGLIGDALLLAGKVGMGIAFVRDAAPGELYWDRAPYGGILFHIEADRRPEQSAWHVAYALSPAFLGLTERLLEKEAEEFVRTAFTVGWCIATDLRGGAK